MDKNRHPSMSSSADLIDSKLEEHQLGGSKQCPGCGYKLHCKPDWFGLPAGVKFDPTDQELIEHLQAKMLSESQQSKAAHPLIDEFIPTIEGEDGICYTHPEKLPGVTRDGLSRHFFHRPSKAYTTGTRKRRKIQTECDLQGGETRWHKTGKTRPVMVNGQQKGCKKILVLYTNFGKHRKPEKTNWVMHQYHLGQYEEEKEGELVVCKIFYQTQPRQCSWSDRTSTGAAVDTANSQSSTEQNTADHNNLINIDQGGGSGSSSCRETSQREHELGRSVGYESLDNLQQLKTSDPFSFAPFRKTFDENSEIKESSSHCVREEHEEHESNAICITQETHQVMTGAYHISRPSNSISTILNPPMQQTSLVVEDSFHVSRLFLQNEKFQFSQNQHQQEQLKLGERTASSSYKLPLEEMFDCTHQGSKDAAAIPNPQEVEWLKYWQEHQHQDHHR